MERQDIVNICSIMKNDGYSRTADYLLRLYDDNAAMRSQLAQCKVALQAAAEYMGEPKPMDEGRAYPDRKPTRYSHWATATNNVIALVRAALEAMG